MAHRTTDALERVDILLAQVEKFAEAAGAEEARARALQVIAYAEREILRERSPAMREQLAQRLLVAEDFLKHIGWTVRDNRGRIVVHPWDAKVPGTWD